MTTYYVGSGGSDVAAGTSYALRFLTLAKAATTVSAAGDKVYITPGTYREQVTMTVSGGGAYATGTVTATNGSTTVTGAGGAAFVTGSVAAGNFFKVAGLVGAIKIASVDSETQLTLVSAYDGVTVAGATYNTWKAIEWIGDYSGANTDGVGGVVRWTGSADDITAARASCIVASSVNYNRIEGIVFDIATSYLVLLTSPTYWIIDKCAFTDNVNSMVYITGASQLGCTVQNCSFSFLASALQAGFVHILHSATVDNSRHAIQNCIFRDCTSASGSGVTIEKVSGFVIKNCHFLGGDNGVNIRTAITVGQTVTVLNNIFCGYTSSALRATTSGEITEDYNNINLNATSRTNTAVGANSIAYPPLFDQRWFFESVA